jgi:hypothetical protein
VYRFLVGKPERRSKRRLDDNIKIDLQEVGWIDLSQNRDKWRALANAVMDFWVP